MSSPSHPTEVRSGRERSHCYPLFCRGHYSTDPPACPCGKPVKQVPHQCGYRGSSTTPVLCQHSTQQLLLPSQGVHLPCGQFRWRGGAMQLVQSPCPAPYHPSTGQCPAPFPSHPVPSHPAPFPSHPLPLQVGALQQIKQPYVSTGEWEEPVRMGGGEWEEPVRMGRVGGTCEDGRKWGEKIKVGVLGRGYFRGKCRVICVLIV